MNFFTKLSTLVTFCIGVTTVDAQTVISEIGSNITSTDQLTNNAKVAFYNTGRSLYVYNSTSRYEMGAAPALNTEGNTAYCWTVEKMENGKFKFKDNTDKYIPVLGSAKNVIGNETGDEFTVTASNGKWLIQGTDGNYFNGNGAGAGFCGWGETGGNSLYEIRMVTTDDLSTFGNYTITMQDESGNVFNTQTVNSKAGYTVNVAAPFRIATSATYNGQPVTITDNTLTIPEGTSKDLTVIYKDNLPFKTTEIQNGQFVNATWYQMGVHNNQNRSYLQYNASDNTIIDLIKSAAIDLSNDNQLWCFSGNLKDGFKIYNKAAGASISITYSTAYGTAGNEHAIMADANADAAVWYLSTSSATESELSNGFCFETKQTTNNKFLNQRQTYMSYWKDNGNGSTFVINDVSTAALEAFNTALNKAKQYVIGSGIGEYQDPDNSFTATLSKANNGAPEDLAELIALTNELTAAPNTLVINQPETGKFYRFKNKVNNNYLSSTAAAGSRPNMVAGSDDASTVYYLSADKKLTGSNLLNMSNYTFASNTGSETSFQASTAYPGCYVIINSGVAYYGTATGSQVDRWGNATEALAKENCAWTLEEVTDAAQQPSLSKSMSAEYATLAAPVALNIPEGVKAYTVTINDDKATATLEEVSDVIPAGTAVVLKKTGSDSDFTFTFAAEGSTSNTNALTGVYADTEISTDINAYILGNGTEGIGFYQMNADDRTLGANKAYLTLPATMQAVRSIVISDGQTTGIESTVAEGTEAEEYYDLQGRRVLNPTKGIYVTKSGKKVVINK